MANLINVYSTITQAKGFQAEAVETTLLGTRYFPNGTGDNFVGSEVLFDFESTDLQKGAFLTSGYNSANTVNFVANSVIPPRVADEETVDPEDYDRILFEQLCRAQGADLDRATAIQDLAVLKATRLATRIDRSIEVLIASILANGKIDFEQETRPGSGEYDRISCKFYDPAKGVNNHYVAKTAWTASGAKPYDDVCAMVNAMVKAGKRPTDLLIGPEAWIKLSEDTKFQKFAGDTFHSNGMALDFGEIDGAQNVATAVFNGMKLNVIVYSAGYVAGDKTFKSFIAPSAVILIAGEIGRTLCGGISVLADNCDYKIENSFINLQGKHLQHLYKDFQNQKLKIRCESRPLPAPRESVNNLTWIYCDTSIARSGGAGVGEVYTGISFNEDEGFTWATHCTDGEVVGLAGDKNYAVSLGTVNSKTVKIFATRDGNKAEEIEVSGGKITLPVDCDKDETGKAIVFATAV